MLSPGAPGCINQEITAVPSPDIHILTAILICNLSLPDSPSSAQCNRGRTSLKKTPHFKKIYY